jgi:two-component system response regulator YesN
MDQRTQIEECIYIVDDESTLAQMANTILSFRGYRARIFNDPVKALEHLKSSPRKPSLLITDCIMGSLSGLELIEESKRAVPQLKTILMSGTITEEFVQKCSVVPDRFIPKPYAADTLLDMVDELMQGPPKEGI